MVNLQKTGLDAHTSRAGFNVWFNGKFACLTKIILFVTYKQRKTAAYNEITPNENKKIINIFIIATKINKILFRYISNIGLTTNLH